MGKKRAEGLVYSTNHGRMCPKCDNPISKCCCKSEKNLPRGDGVVRLKRESKGRKGKGVTLITGVPLPEKDLKELCKELKQKCGTGGTVKNGVIEIQGDRRELLQPELVARGWVVKIAGG